MKTRRRLLSFLSLTVILSLFVATPPQLVLADEATFDASNEKIAEEQLALEDELSLSEETPLNDLIPLETDIATNTDYYELIPLETDMATTTDELLLDNTDDTLPGELPMIEEGAITVLDDIVDDEDKFYFNADYLDIYDCSDDCVIVGMKKAYSQVNKYYPDDYFGSLFYKVEDISYVEGDTGNNPLVNYEGFHQILKLYLVTPGKENVLLAIRELELRDDVRSAVPEYRNVYQPAPSPSPTQGTKSNLPPTGDFKSMVYSTLLLVSLSSGFCMVRKHRKRQLHMCEI